MIDGKRFRVAAASALSLGMAACGGSQSTTSTATIRARPPQTTTASTTVATSTPAPPPKPPPPPYPQLLGGALGTGSASFAPAVRWKGHVAAWVSRTGSGAAVLTFDQRYLELNLHSGTVDAGTLGWRFGPSVGGAELRRLAAAFNGGFRLSTGAGGFESYGHVAVPLQNGVGSIVTYSNGFTDIGTWRHEVPARGLKVVSVRQNLAPLIDHGGPAGSVGCDSCWGATLGGVSDPARSAVGVTANGRLVYAGGEHLTVSALVNALLAAHVVRAVELDINPEWVAAYVYGHRRGKGRLAPISAVPGQQGIPGEFLAPWSRDFFTVAGR